MSCLRSASTTRPRPGDRITQILTFCLPRPNALPGNQLNVCFWPKADPNLTQFLPIRTAAFGKSGHSDRQKLGQIRVRFRPEADARQADSRCISGAGASPRMKGDDPMSQASKLATFLRCLLIDEDVVDICFDEGERSGTDRAVRHETE